MNIYNKKYNFLKLQKIISVCTNLFSLYSLGAFFTKGLNLGVDFKGGTVIEMKLAQPYNSEDIRKSLLKINLGDVSC